MPDTPSLFCHSEPLLQRAWDATSFRLAMECWRKYWYRIIRGIAPVLRNVDMSFGSYLHTGLEAYDRAICSGEDHEAALLTALRGMLVAAGSYTTVWTCGECQHQWEEPHPWEAVCNRCRVDLVEVPPASSVRWDPWDSDSKQKNRRTLVRALIWTLDEFAKGNIRPHALSDGSAATEVHFVVPLDLLTPDGDPYLLCGYYDSLAEIGGPDLVMPRERKTTGSTLGKAFFGRFDFDLQIDTYALSRKLTGKTPGVIIEAIQTAVGFSRAKRSIVQPSEAQLEEFQETLRGWIGQAEVLARAGRAAAEGDGSAWPMNRANCNMYRREDIKDKLWVPGCAGGCPYRDLCTKARSVRKIYEAGNYEVRRWNPLMKRRE